MKVRVPAGAEMRRALIATTLGAILGAVVALFSRKRT